jgi:hypothetical protein
MKALYDFHWDCGRMGDVEGLFVADKETVQKYIGKDVYFGEILGKHSEVYGILGQEDLTIVSEDQDKIEWLVEIMKGSTISGRNPLDYVEE